MPLLISTCRPILATFIKPKSCITAFANQLLLNQKQELLNTSLIKHQLLLDPVVALHKTQSTALTSLLLLPNTTTTTTSAWRLLQRLHQPLSPAASDKLASCRLQLLLTLHTGQTDNNAIKVQNELENSCCS